MTPSHSKMIPQVVLTQSHSEIHPEIVMTPSHNKHNVIATLK